MKRATWAVVTIVAGLGLLAPPAGGSAHGPAPSTVMVESGPTSYADVVRQCDDAVSVIEAATTFVVTRPGDTNLPVVVGYTVTGTARAGLDYVALPGVATVESGASSATIEVEPLPGEDNRPVDLTLTLEPGIGYEVIEPESATIEFVAPRDPALPPEECGFGFSEGAWTRTITVGGRPAALEVTVFIPPVAIPAPPEVYTARLLGGTLPPGLSFEADGTFTGEARTTGDFTSEVEACRNEEPWTCDTATLTIHVNPDPAPPIAEVPDFTG